MKPITNEQADFLLKVIEEKCVICITETNMGSTRYTITELPYIKKSWLAAGIVEKPEETALEKARRMRKAPWISPGISSDIAPIVLEIFHLYEQAIKEEKEKNGERIFPKSWYKDNMKGI